MAPIITKLSPPSGPESGGTIVTISGSGFTTGGEPLATISFGGNRAITANVDSDTQITALSPPGTGQVNVAVRTLFDASATSAASLFSFVKSAEASPPTVTGITPSGGPMAGGIDVDIYGIGLLGATAVNFGPMVVTTPTVVDDTHVTVVLPALADGFVAGSVHVTVVTPAGTSSASDADNFDYLGLPTVTGLSPTTGAPAGGDVVQLFGTGLSQASQVWFGAQQGFGITTDGDGQLAVFSPPSDGGSNVHVTVVTPGGTSETSDADLFLYGGGDGVPALSSIDPVAGTLGAATVTLYGSGLTGVSAVWFAGVPASELTPIDDTQLRVSAPPMTSEVDADVIVQGAGGFSARTDSAVYQYLTDDDYANWLANPGGGGGGGKGTTARLLTVFIQATFTINHVNRTRDGGVAIKNGSTVEIFTLNEDMSIEATGLSSVTTANGVAGQTQFDISSLADGNYLIHISAEAVGQQSTVPAGPALDPGTADALFRDLDVYFELKNGSVVAGSTGAMNDATWGDCFQEGPLRIRVDWKPDWWRAVNRAPRAAGASVDFIVVHRTVGTLWQAKGLHDGGADKVSAHYLVDKDGHVVKLVKDDEIANQAGDSWYDGVMGLNAVSIGIEHVNNVGEAYTDPQMQASLTLIQALVDQFQVPKKHLVGHVDVSVANTQLSHGPINLFLSGRGMDPGPEYDWTLLAGAGLSVDASLDPSVDVNTIYGGYFATAGNQIILNDRDAGHRYGGKTRAGFSGLIAELQDDLSTIGYAISTDPTGTTVTGVYDNQTASAVARLVVRFSRFFATRPVSMNLGGVSTDAATAVMIKTVLAAL
jgi:N-acetyl-anhydromuramyl-L-alanine amidase AmpD